MHRIVVLDPIAPATAARLRALLPEGFVLDHGTTRGDAHLQAIIANADFAIAGQVGVSGDVLRAARRLRLLHKWGVGVDNLDLATAAACGITVARTTGSNALPVAEFTIGLIFAALRHTAHAHARLQQGEWIGGRLPRDAFTLSGKTVGIVGFGAIGQRLAKLLSGFDCTLLYSKRTPLAPQEEAALGARHAALDELLAASDVVTLHCPLTPETTGLIDAAALARMKKTAVLVNVARGGVVVENDLVAALRAGTLHAAAMDVFDIEPLPADSPLIGLDNLVLTPHLAAVTADTFAPTVLQMFGNIQRAARGEPLPPADVVVP